MVPTSAPSPRPPTMEHLLNPFTEEDELRFNSMFRGKKSREQQQSPLSSGEMEDVDSVEDDVMRELPGTERTDSDNEESDDNSCDDDDDDEEKQQAALFLATLAETMTAATSASSHQPASSSSSPTLVKGLYEQKVDRIVLKIRRLTKELARAHSGIPRLVLVCGGAKSVIKSLSEFKIMRKTVNQSAATVAFVVFKKLGINLPLLTVVEALKKGEKLGSLSKSTKPNYARNQAEVLGISKMVTSLETHTNTSPLPEETHSKTCQEATVKLARDLDCDEKLEKLAVTYCTQSEQSSMASRHKGTVGASCVLLAAKSLGHRLTLAKVSEVSGVSTCTIRKSLKALESLISKTAQ